MAMQAGIGASKILILVGAGVGGSVILRNGRISDLLSDLSKVLFKHLKEDEGEGSSNDNRDSIAVLSAQVRRMSQELRQLASTSRPITLVNGSNSGGAGVGSLVVPVVVVGAAGYGYMWWKGWSFSDVMYVTKRNMSHAVASVSKQLEQVSAALVATKRHLTSRLDVMSQSLEDHMIVTHAIKAQVTEVCGEVQAVGLEMREVNKHIEGLEEKMDQVQSKQDFTNHGIYLLCRFVLQGLEGSGQKPELLQGFHAYSRSRLDRTSSAPFSASAGLKELQSFSDQLLMVGGTNVEALPNSISSPNLQRSITASTFSAFIPRPYAKS